MKSIYIYILIIFLTISINNGFSQDANKQDTIDILSLSLEELLNIKVVGSVVRDLNFDKITTTDNLVDVTNFNSPVSIDIITSKTIEARGLKNIIEATDNAVGIISGISPAEPYGFSMRGFSRDDVKILYDGVLLGISTRTTRPLGTSNLNRIEIIKGPAALSNGFGGAGGTINIIGKHPELSNHHIRKFNIAYGSYNTSIITGEISGPINKKFAYLVDAGRTGSNGWVDRTKSLMWNLNTELLWQPNSKFNTSFSFLFASDNLPGYFGTPLMPESEAIDPLGVVLNDNSMVIDGAIRNNNYNVGDYSIGSDTYKLTQDFTRKISNNIRNDIRLYFASTEREWENSENYTFDSETNKVVRDRLAISHDQTVWGMKYGLKIKNKIFGLNNALGIGLEYYNNDFSRDVGFLNGIQDSVDIVNPEPGYFGTVESRNDFLKEEDIAILIDNRIEFTSKLSLQTALRLERVYINRVRFDFDGLPRANQSIDKSNYQASGKIGLVYKFIDNLMAYGQFSYNHGPFAGDISTISLSSASNFSPSDLMQTELGVKSILFNETLDITFALFDIKRRIEYQLDDGITSENDQFSRGFEIAGKKSFDKKIKLGGSFAYTHARYGDYYDADYDRMVSNNTPPNVPKIIGNFWASFNNIANLPIEIGAGGKYVSDRQANTLNSVTLSAYTIFNVFAAYAFEKYRIAFHIRNLTNSDYVPWSDLFYPNQFILGTPRTYEISFIGRF